MCCTAVKLIQNITVMACGFRPFVGCCFYLVCSDLFCICRVLLCSAASPLESLVGAIHGDPKHVSLGADFMQKS